MEPEPHHQRHAAMTEHLAAIELPFVAGAYRLALIEPRKRPLGILTNVEAPVGLIIRQPYTNETNDCDEEDNGKFARS